MHVPQKTGISNITDKLVVIRHATGTDKARVEQYLNDHGGAGELANAEVVIAAEDDRIIGFGILKKEQEAGCVSLFEDSRRKGIGSPILKHLVAEEPLKRIYATRSVSYFTNYGFARGRTGRTARSVRTGGRCTAPLMERLSIAAYQKS